MFINSLGKRCGLRLFRAGGCGGSALFYLGSALFAFCKVCFEFCTLLLGEDRTDLLEVSLLGLRAYKLVTGEVGLARVTTLCFFSAGFSALCLFALCFFSAGFGALCLFALCFFECCSVGSCSARDGCCAYAKVMLNMPTTRLANEIFILEGFLGLTNVLLTNIEKNPESSNRQPKMVEKC